MSEAGMTCLTIHNLTVVGLGDGNIVVYNNDTQECLYGYFIWINLDSDV